MQANSTQKLFDWKGNPFTFKIIPELFVGYDKEVNKIMHSINTGSKFSLLLGATGSGKTTMMKWLLDKMKNYEYVLYLSKPPKNPNDWIGVFNRFTRRRFLGLISRTDGVSLYNLSEAVNKRLGQKKCILFVDECHEASIESLEWLRTLTDHINNLSIILAGLPVFEQTLKNSLETFMMRITARVELSNLTKSETRELIKKRIENAGGDDIRPFTTGSVDFIYEKTGGFPREIIKICNDYVQSAVEKNISTIDADFIKETEAPKERVSLDTINGLPDRQRLILETLASHGPLTPSEIVARVKIEEYKNRDNAIRAVNNLLRRLMKEGFAERKRIGKTYKYVVSSKFYSLMVSA